MTRRREQLEQALSQYYKLLEDNEREIEEVTDPSVRSQYTQSQLQLKQSIKELESEIEELTSAIEVSPIVQATSPSQPIRENKIARPNPPSETFFAGLLLADTYRLEKRLGKGGMGEVWLANHTLLNEPRAIKFVLASYSSLSEIRERFIQGEARNALRLIHPHIVRVYELGQFQQMPYMVMEYVTSGEHGTDLKGLIKAKAKFSLEYCGELLNQLASALMCAHQQGLIHRDIKPANILITADGSAKLSDFGIVKDLQAAEDVTSTGVGVGTPTYMSPEQAEGKAERRSDQYSLGIVLYEMLTGKTPFAGPSSFLLVQHATTKPTPLSELNPGIPLEISTVVMKALAKKPDDRYPSVLDFAKAYQTALVNTTSSAFDRTMAIDISVATGTNTARTTGTQATATTSSTTTHNLPSQFTRFMGRTQEIGEIATLLKEPQTRLVTLTGAGGTGKTRLSLEIAAQVLGDFSSGVFFVPLETVRERNTLVSAIASVLEVKESGGKNLLDNLKDYVQDKSLLLVLDNFEQLVEAAAPLVSELLRAAADLKVLVSSRINLQITGEREYAVQPLSLPDSADPKLTPEKLHTYPSTALFIERAKAVRDSFTVTEDNTPIIALICAKLDGLPLAIELAAARVKTFPPERIAERLSLKLLTGGARDLPQRQQTLKGAIDWSYDLLNEQERVFLSRLAVFAGGWSVEAAEAVSIGDYDGGSIEDFDVLELLSQLVNKSLIVVQTVNGELRYRLLETIREYAHEKLVERGAEEQLRAEHAKYYLEWAEQIEPELTGTQQAKWFALLRLEYGNLRTGLGWALEQKADVARVELALRYVGTLRQFWVYCAYFSEGHQWAEKAVKAAEALDEPEAIASTVRINAYKAAGTLSNYQVDLAAARAYYEKGLEIALETNDKVGIAGVYNNLGTVVHLQGDFATARAMYEEGYKLFMELGQVTTAAVLLNNLGMACRDQADYIAALDYLEQSLSIQRQQNNKRSIPSVLNSLGEVSLDLGNFEAVASFLSEGLEILQELGNKRGMAYYLEQFGALAVALGQIERAGRLAGAASSLREKISLPLSSVEQEKLNQRLQTAQNSPKWAKAWESGRVMSLEQACAYALEQ